MIKMMKRMLSLDSLIAVRLPGDGNKLLLATSRPLMSVFFLRYLVSSSLSSSSSTSYRWLPDYKTLPDTSHPHQHPCHQQKQYYLSLLTKLLHSLPSPHKSARPVRKKLMSIGGGIQVQGNSGDDFVLLGDLNAWNNNCVVVFKEDLNCQNDLRMIICETN